MDIVWVSKDIDAIKVKLLYIFDQADSWFYMFSYICVYYIQNHTIITSYSFKIHLTYTQLKKWNFK
jgi:hypothetical protein